MNKIVLSVFAIVSFITCVTSCSSCDVNSIQDPHFAQDGAPLDTIEFFQPRRPESIKLYVETSGSMNGFFRANQPNKFKKTVNSVFTGLEHRTDGKVYGMSVDGKIDEPQSIGTFVNNMNGGKFVSSSSTKIPEMLKSIIKNIDSTKEEVAVLVSDMKYSPMGRDAAVAIDQYQEEIRNLTAKHNYGVAFVCAESEFIGKNGKVAEEKSPYYYIIIGKPENVSAVCNDIVTWCEATDSFIESGHLSMAYKTPSYEIRNVDNGYLSYDYPKNVIDDYSPKFSDTCQFVVRVNLTGYPAGIESTVLDSCFKATTAYGADISTGLIANVDDHQKDGKFEREAYADYLIKVSNLPLACEVVELTFCNRPFDGRYFDEFNQIINAQNEDDLSGSFSFNKFIKGHFNARFNVYDLEPVQSGAEPRHVRILISEN